VHKWVVSEFVWKITFNIKHFNYIIFYWEVTSHIYNTRSKFNNRWVLLTVYQVTIHNKCPQHPPTQQMHPWTHLPMECHNLPRSWGSCEWFAGIKLCWWSFSSSSFGAEYARAFKCSHKSVLMIEVGRTWGLYLERCLRRYIDINFVLLWETHCWSLSKHFRYTLYN